MAAEPRSPRTALRILFAVILLDLIGFGIVIPILPFLSPTLGADKLDIALIIVAYAVCAGLSGAFWGRLSDRLGRRRVIMICLAGSALSYGMLAFASALWMIYAARAFAGLVAGNFGVASAMVADITPPEGRAGGMGLIGAAFGLGLVLGPLLGGLLSGDSGTFRLPCLLAGTMSLLAILAAALFLPESLSAERMARNRRHQRETDSESVYRMLRRTGNRLLAFQYILHNSCVSAITYITPLWVADLLGWGAREVGILFGVLGAIMVVLQGGAMGPLTRVLGEYRFLVLTNSALLAGTVIAIGATEATAMVAAVYIALTGATLAMPLLNTLATHRTPQADRGRMLGSASGIASWGRVVGPLLAGANLTLFGYAASWTGCAVLAILYFAWAVREYRRHGRSSIAQEDYRHGHGSV